MAQAEVEKFLQKNRDWISVREIYNNLKIGKGNIRRSLKQMHKYGEVSKAIKPIPKKGECRIYWRIK